MKEYGIEFTYMPKGKLIAVLNGYEILHLSEFDLNVYHIKSLLENKGYFVPTVKKITPLT